MSIESGVFEEERKRKKANEKSKKQEIQKVIESQKKIKEIESHIDADSELSWLKDLLDNSQIDTRTKKIIEKVVDGEEITTDEVQKIFEKIDEIENIKDIDIFIPQNLRVSKQEYSKSLHDEASRKKTIIKLDDSLTLMARQVNTGDMWGMNLFSGFLSLLDKNLVLAQEHTIDIKNSLQRQEQDKRKQQNLSLWEKFLLVLKEILR